ncbi:EndoS/ChiA family endoglycosidase [Caviibacter abscessus]|uniref:EndoS/ChiA family endoglycosidase n=1 Tax=Caviibacter abscessus TaxID=1766719 RepID=UPI000831AD4D|nr:hypothetical protein [Caviibacter abscessus]
MIKKFFVIALLSTISSIALAQEKIFMGYYRIWRDKTFEQDNNNLTGKNELTMLDIPEGVNIVNVFGYDKYAVNNDSNKYQEYFKQLKDVYGPKLRKRGVKLVYGINYKRLIEVPIKINNGQNNNSEPTDTEIDAWAKELYEQTVLKYGLDGIDIDMELRYEDTKKESEDSNYLTTRKINIGEKMIKALGKYLGPKSSNKETLLLYDTNSGKASEKAIGNVKDHFNYFFYQNYGKGNASNPRYTNLEKNNERVYKDLNVDKEKFIPGLTYAEELSKEGQSKFINYHINDFSKSMLNLFAKDNKYGGMFVYALDRDGMTHNSPDDKKIIKTNFLWTKTLIQTLHGTTVENAKKAVSHNLDRIKYLKELEEKEKSKEVDGNKEMLLQLKENNTFKKKAEEAKKKIESANTLFDVNKEILGLTEIGEEKIKELNPDYDPMLESKLMQIKEIEESKKVLDEIKDDERKEYEIDKSYRELVHAIGDKRPVAKNIIYKLGQLRVAKVGVFAEEEKLKRGVFSSIELTNNNTLDDRFNFAYTFSKQKYGYYHNINASGLINGNMGVMGNVATTFKDLNFLAGIYYSVDTKVGTYVPSVGFLYVLNREKVDTHFLAVRVDNSFKFDLYKNNEFTIKPTVDLNMEAGSYRSTINKNSTEFKFLYNHKVKLGVDFGYKINNFNINTRLGVYNTFSLSKKIENKYTYDFGGSIDAKLEYNINPTTVISLNGGYSRTINNSSFSAGLEFNKLF